MNLSKIPAAWVIVGITALLYGWLPRMASVLSWVIIGLFIIIEMLWEAGIASWSVMKLTPFDYIERHLEDELHRTAHPLSASYSVFHFQKHNLL